MINTPGLIQMIKEDKMTNAEILRLKLKLEDSLLDDKGKEEFLTKTDIFMMFLVLEMR